MEGGVMLARTHRDLEPFDAAVRQLRRFLDALQSFAAQPREARRAAPRTIRKKRKEESR
jgi:hypothetical protein